MPVYVYENNKGSSTPLWHGWEKKLKWGHCHSHMATLNYAFYLKSSTAQFSNSVKRGGQNYFRTFPDLIMQCFTSIKPPYIVGPVFFGLFDYNLGKTMFL